MTPPILLDLSRLLSRAGKPSPTGIDRIELAYAEHLLAREGERLRFVAINATGEYGLLHMSVARRLIEALAAAWRDPDLAGRAAQRAGRLSHLSALTPRRPAARTAAARAAGGRPVFLSVSHKNLHRAGPLLRLRARTDAAFVFYVHDLIPMEFPEYARPGQAERHRKRIATVSAMADAVLVNSRATAAALAPHLPPHVPVQVAYPGAAFADFVHPRGAEPVAPYFVCLGTIEPRKNHLLLLHLWRQLAAAGGASPPRLLLVGRRGWENENVVDILERCAALSGLVEEPGTVSDRALPALLTGARALLAPAFAEGYGMPVAEALALRVPVICSDIAAHREVGRNVPEFLSPLDGAGWMTAIGDFARAAAPRRAAQAARLRGWDAPGWAAHFDTVFSLIESLASSVPARARQGEDLRILGVA